MIFGISRIYGRHWEGKARLMCKRISARGRHLFIRSKSQFMGSRYRLWNECALAVWAEQQNMIDRSGASAGDRSSS